jgi:hypothetical protein
MVFYSRPVVRASAHDCARHDCPMYIVPDVAVGTGLLARLTVHVELFITQNRKGVRLAVPPELLTRADEVLE